MKTILVWYATATPVAAALFGASTLDEGSTRELLREFTNRAGVTPKIELRAGLPYPWVDGSWATAHADGSGRVYPNFPDPALEDWAVAYHAGNRARLAAVKHAYDRHRCFEFSQAI
jgi:Berberine and berberine like